MNFEISTLIQRQILYLLESVCNILVKILKVLDLLKELRNYFELVRLDHQLDVCNVDRNGSLLGLLLLVPSYLEYYLTLVALGHVVLTN